MVFIGFQDLCGLWLNPLHFRLKNPKTNKFNPVKSHDAIYIYSIVIYHCMASLGELYLKCSIFHGSGAYIGLNLTNGMALRSFGGLWNFHLQLKILTGSIDTILVATPHHHAIKVLLQRRPVETTCHLRSTTSNSEKKKRYAISSWRPDQTFHANKNFC